MVFFSRCSVPWLNTGMSAWEVFHCSGHAVKTSSCSDHLSPWHPKTGWDPVCEWANGEVGTPQYLILAVALCWWDEKPRAGCVPQHPQACCVNSELYQGRLSFWTKQLPWCWRSPWFCCPLGACQVSGDPSLLLLLAWRSWGVWRRWPFPGAALLLSSPFPPAPGAANHILHSPFPLPFLPGFQLHLRFQAREASSWRSRCYGWQHSLSSGWQRTLYRTHDLIMTSCLPKFILPFHMDRNVLFHALLSPSILK